MEIGQEYKGQINNVLTTDPERNFSVFEMTLVNEDKSIDFEYITEAGKEELTTPETMDAILYFVTTAMSAIINDFSVYDKYDFTPEEKEKKINQCKINLGNAMILFGTNDKKEVTEKLLELQKDVDFILGNETQPE